MNIDTYRNHYILFGSPLKYKSKADFAHFLNLKDNVDWSEGWNKLAKASLQFGKKLIIICSNPNASGIQELSKRFLAKVKVYTYAEVLEDITNPTPVSEPSKYTKVQALDDMELYLIVEKWFDSFIKSESHNLEDTITHLGSLFLRADVAKPNFLSSILKPGTTECNVSLRYCKGEEYITVSMYLDESTGLEETYDTYTPVSESTNIKFANHDEVISYEGFKDYVVRFCKSAYKHLSRIK